MTSTQSSTNNTGTSSNSSHTSYNHVYEQEYKKLYLLLLTNLGHDRVSLVLNHDFDGDSDSDNNDQAVDEIMRKRSSRVKKPIFNQKQQFNRNSGKRFGKQYTKSFADFQPSAFNQS